MLGFSGSPNQFVRIVQDIELATGWRTSRVGKDSAFFYIPGQDSYPLYLSGFADGTGALSCASQVYWAGREPAVAHQVMEELDQLSNAITYRVERGENGKTRCWASVLGGLERMTPTAVARAAGEMIGAMSGADRLFRKYGFA